MHKTLPQQRLFLEWLVMSGNIAVPDSDNGSLLYQTQIECEQAGWVTLTPFGSGFFMAKITDKGKDMVKDRRATATIDKQDLDNKESGHLDRRRNLSQ